MLEKEKLFLWRIELAKAWKKLATKFVLPTSMCKVCFKEISPQSWLHLAHPKAKICSACFRSFSPHFKAIKLDGVTGLSIYSYDEVIREKLYQLKGCFDQEIAPVFLDFFRRELHWNFRKFVAVPAPSWEGDNQLREFNHVVEIFKVLGLPIQMALVKTEHIKQADLNFEKRQEVSQRIELSANANLKGKYVLFVDDVLTSGATAKACIHLLQQAGAKKIRFLVMAKTEKPKEKRKKETNENINTSIR